MASLSVTARRAWARPAPFSAGSAQGRRRVSGTAQCLPQRWPDPDFVEATKQAFEGGIYAKPLASAEEARVLLGNGWKLVDIRPALEVELVGKVRDSVHIPFVNATRKFDPEQNKSIVISEPNARFLETIERTFRDKEGCRLLVADSNGKSGAQDALSMLEDAGYINLVGLVGGFNAFWRRFDAKLQRRPSRGAFLEDPYSPGSSQGMFAGES